MLHHTQLLNRLIRDKKLVPGQARSTASADVTYHDPCYLGRHNKVYEAPRELIGASGAKLTEMPRHADRGLCCGAGGARMWMEEHIGKRVNHERVEEALDTGASKIATGCPFCRVMITDGVDDVAAATDVPKAEVLDVAQLLLGSLDKSSVTLPEKGTAAKEAEERAARVEASAPAVEAAPAEAEAGSRSRKPRRRPKLNRRPAGRNQAGHRARYRRWGEAPWRQEGGGPRREAPAAARSSARQGARHRRGRKASRRQEGRTRRIHRRSARRGRPTKTEPAPHPRQAPGASRRPAPSQDSASPREHGVPAPRRPLRPAPAAAAPQAAARSTGRAGQARTRGQGARHRPGCPAARREEGAGGTETRCATTGTGFRRRIQRCA